MLSSVTADQISLRNATAGDLSEVSKLERDHGPDSWSPATLAGYLDCEQRWFIVACLGGEVIGYLVAEVMVDRVEIHSVAVHQSWRRRGVGTSLMKKVSASASSLPVTLEVRDHNVGARRWYAAMGFKEIGRRPGYYPGGEDGVLLEVSTSRGDRRTTSFPSWGAPRSEVDV